MSTTPIFAVTWKADPEKGTVGGFNWSFSRSSVLNHVQFIGAEAIPFEFEVPTSSTRDDIIAMVDDMSESILNDTKYMDWVAHRTDIGKEVSTHAIYLGPALDRAQAVEKALLFGVDAARYSVCTMFEYRTRELRLFLEKVGGE